MTHKLFSLKIQQNRLQHIVNKNPLFATNENFATNGSNIRFGADYAVSSLCPIIQARARENLSSYDTVEPKTILPIKSR